MLASTVEAEAKRSQVNTKVKVKRNQISGVGVGAEEELIVPKSPENESLVPVKRDHGNVVKAKNVLISMIPVIRTTQTNMIVQGAKVQNGRIKKNNLKTKTRLYECSKMDHIESCKCLKSCLFFFLKS